MLAALALLAAAPVGPLQDGPTGAVRSEDPGLVLHLTGDEAGDAAELERLGLELEGFMPTTRGLVGPGYEVALCAGEDRVFAHLGGFELGASGALEFWFRPMGDALGGFFGAGSVQLYGMQLDGTSSLYEDRELILKLEVDGVGLDRELVYDLLPRGVIEPDRWHHLALVHDEGTTGTVRLVLDGVPQVVEHASSPERSRIDAGASEEPGWLMVHIRSAGLSLDIDELRVHDRFVSTAELRERWRAGIGSPGRATSLAEPRLATPAAWAAGTFERAVPDAAAATWVAAHWSRDRPAPGPHARTCHAVVPAGPGRLLVFGGELRDTHAGRMANGDDAWIYHLDEQRWERVAGGVTGRTSAELREAHGRASELVPQDPSRPRFSLHGGMPRLLPDFAPLHGPAPDPRCHQGMAFDPTTNTAFLLGGWFNDGHRGGPRYDDVWLLDLDTNTWRRLPQTEPVPAITDVQPIFHAGLGRFLFATRSAVWSLDPDTGLLVRERDPLVLDQRLAPLARRETTAQAMTWYDPDQGAVLRFGGFWVTPAPQPGGELGLERTNALMAYSHELGAWVVMDTPEVAPSPRVRGAVAYDTKRDRAVLFGGITGELDDRTSDLWTFDAKAKRWTEHRASNAPGPRGGYFGMAYDEERDAFVVPFGRQDTMTFLDEVWRLSFDEEAWGSASWRFDRAGWEPGLEPAVVWVGPEGAEEELEPRVSLRGSGDGLTFGPWGPDAGDERFVELRVELAPGMRLTSIAFE